jgi:hypothetical protein
MRKSGITIGLCALPIGAIHRAKGAEHATVARIRFQVGIAGPAIVKYDSLILGHDFRVPGTALRTR